MKQKGFTIIELVMVIAIIGILGLIIVPAYNGYQDTAKRNEALETKLQVRKICNNDKCYEVD